MFINTMDYGSAVKTFCHLQQHGWEAIMVGEMALTKTILSVLIYMGIKMDLIEGRF